MDISINTAPLSLVSHIRGIHAATTRVKRSCTEANIIILGVWWMERKPMDTAAAQMIGQKALEVEEAALIVGTVARRKS